MHSKKIIQMLKYCICSNWFIMDILQKGMKNRIRVKKKQLQERVYLIIYTSHIVVLMLVKNRFLKEHKISKINEANLQYHK